MENSYIFTIIFHNIFWFGKIIFEIFNMSKNNLISVKLAKVLGYTTYCSDQLALKPHSTWAASANVCQIIN
jgi:hypothetical protein